MTAEPEPFVKARRHLARRDPLMKTLIARVGACTLQPDPDRFAVLVRAIVSQQISTKAAVSIGARLRAALGKRGVHPVAVARVADDKLRGAGLSSAKARAVRDLATKVLEGGVALDTIHTLPDEDVIAHLLPVHGIGRWTAEMFLIFGLGRLDVLPLAALGLRAGVRRHFGLPEIPPKERIVELTETWRPYRSVATWYLWRSFDVGQ